MRGRTVLVTGATGFIGAHLVRRLLEQDSNVQAVSRRPPAVGDSPIRWHQADLADPDAAGRLVAAVRPDTIFHLASHVAGSRSADLVLPTFHANLASTVNLLSAVTKTPCRRFILTGSLEEPESTAESPSSPYAAAKVAARQYAAMFHTLYGIPIVLARLFMVYGPDQKDDRKLVPYVIRSLLAGTPMQLSPGMRPVDWIYVDDVVRGLLAMAVAPNAVEGARFDLGSGRLATVRTVVEKIAALVRQGLALPFGALPERPFEQVRTADVAATTAALGWAPTTSLDDGLRLTVDWYKTHPVMEKAT